MCNSPFSAFSSVPGPELDWLPTEEGGAKRLFSSSLPWATSPPSELLRESLRAEREEEVLLVSLRGLLELRPVWDKKKKKKDIEGHFLNIRQTPYLNDMMVSKTRLSLSHQRIRREHLSALKV